MIKIKKITIATPMYGGQCHGSYLISILNFINECSIKNISVEFSYTTNESLIQRARNILAAKFLMTDSDVLLFIDGDIRFDGKEMLDMVLEGKDVIGAITPLKKFNYGAIVDGAIASQSIANSHRLGGYYNFNEPITEEVENYLLEGKSFKVNRIGTGVLSIYRNVLEKMIPTVKNYIDDNPIGKKETMYDFFPVTIEYDEGWGASRMMSEDYNFCNNWVKLGGDIWAKDGIVQTHAGTFEFSQCLTEDVKVKKIIESKLKK
jgi:hypothetical protein